MQRAPSGARFFLGRKLLVEARLGRQALRAPARRVFVLRVCEIPSGSGWGG